MPDALEFYSGLAEPIINFFLVTAPPGWLSSGAVSAETQSRFTFLLRVLRVSCG